MATSGIPPNAAVTFLDKGGLQAGGRGPFLAPWTDSAARNADQ